MGLFDRFSKKLVPLEEQLKVLASCNITLNPGMGVEHLLESQAREVYQKEPYGKRKLTTIGWISRF